MSMALLLRHTPISSLATGDLVPLTPDLPPSVSAGAFPNAVDTADLINRNGVWWLHVVVSVPAPDVKPTDEIVGVDLGSVQPAVTSNNCFLGKPARK